MLDSPPGLFSRHGPRCGQHDGLWPSVIETPADPHRGAAPAGRPILRRGEAAFGCHRFGNPLLVREGRAPARYTIIINLLWLWLWLWLALPWHCHRICF